MLVLSEKQIIKIGGTALTVVKLEFGIFTATIRSLESSPSANRLRD